MSTDRVEAELRDFARLQVRAGLGDHAEWRAQVVEAIRAELPQQATNADVLARAWLAKADADLALAARSWPNRTDADRLEAALVECEANEVAVFRGIADHRAARDELASRPGLRGAAWFTPADLWHAVDHRVLELTLWHGDGKVVATEDSLFGAVTSCIERHGLRSRPHDGRVQVACHWQRRP